MAPAALNTPSSAPRTARHHRRDHQCKERSARSAIARAEWRHLLLVRARYSIREEPTLQHILGSLTVVTHLQQSIWRLEQPLGPQLLLAPVGDACLLQLLVQTGLKLQACPNTPQVDSRQQNGADRRAHNTTHEMPAQHNTHSSSRECNQQLRSQVRSRVSWIGISVVLNALTIATTPGWLCCQPALHAKFTTSAQLCDMC
jgi:hypothetical protein